MTWLVVAWGSSGEETRQRCAQAPRPAQAGTPTENGGCVSAVTRSIGNDEPRKAAAPARCFGIEGHVGNHMHDFETLGRIDGCASSKRCGQKVRERRSCWCPRFVSAGLRAGGARFRSGLERGANSFGSSCSQQVRWVKAQSQREAQGSNGRTSRGNANGEQRTLGGETPEVEATFGERIGFGRSCRTEEGQPREGLDIR